ncbi:MAG: hypothetical protein ABIV94_02445 [Acidimicrobiales bacterium]
MPSPMGPVPPDPDDPDLWPEFDQDSDDLWDDETFPRRWPTGMRIVALLVLVAFVLVYAISLR